MQSLKEKGWKLVSNDAFKIDNINRHLYGWVATLATQPYKHLQNLTLTQKGIYYSIFNILLSYLLFLPNVPFSFNFLPS